MSRRVLVTGAGGYIGSVLVRELLKERYKVSALDKFYFGKETLPDNHDDLETIVDDIRIVNPDVFKGVDYVIDLASISNDPSGELNPISTISINHLGRLRVCMLAKSSGVKRYLLASSCSVYGYQDGDITEKSKVHPLTTYAESNYNIEEDVKQLNDDKFTVVILRQATVYGSSPRMRFDLAINGMVKGFIQNGKIPILRDGTQWRPFIHVKDICKAMIMCLKADNKLIGGEVFNVGHNDHNYQILPLAKTIAQSLQLSFQYEWYGNPDHRSYRVRFDKIRDRLGFKPDYDASIGAREVFSGIKQGQLNINDPTTITVSWYKSLMEKGILL